MTIMPFVTKGYGVISAVIVFEFGKVVFEFEEGGCTEAEV